jgi:hypothetical protein
MFHQQVSSPPFLNDLSDILLHFQLPLSHLKDCLTALALRLTLDIFRVMTCDAAALTLLTSVTVIDYMAKQLKKVYLNSSKRYFPLSLAQTLYVFQFQDFTQLELVTTYKFNLSL